MLSFGSTVAHCQVPGYRQAHITDYNMLLTEFWFKIGFKSLTQKIKVMLQFGIRLK